MSKLLPRLFAVLFSIGCCSPIWAQLTIDASCSNTTVQCLADLDEVTCPDSPAVLDAEGQEIGTADCLLVSERENNRQLCAATTAFPNSGSNAGALVLYNIPGSMNSQYFVPTGAGLQLERFESGEAILSGTVAGVADPTEIWHIFIAYEGLTSDNEHVANGGGLKYDAGCAPVDTSTVEWDIYYMNNGLSYLQGAGSLDGSLLSLNHAPANQYFGFQIGEGGNDRNCNYGAGGWFSWSGTIKGEEVAGAMGDVLVDLECQPQEPKDGCDASVTCYCVGVDLENDVFEVFTCTTQRLDDTPPTWVNPPADVTIQCTEEPPAVAEFTAEDNCEPGDEEIIEAAYQGEVTINPDGLNGCYTIERTWTAEDACGNDTAYTQVITVEDNEAPTWDDYEPYVMESCLVILTQEEAEDPTLVPITATDNCDPDLDYSIEAHEISGGCPTTWLRKWTATDDCDNSSVVVEQYVQLYDETPPAMDAPADITIYLDGYCGYDSDPTYTGTPIYSDHCSTQERLDSMLTYSDVDGAVTCAGDDDTPEGSFTITRTWSTTDFCGNANDDSHTITVLDTISPVGTVLGATIDCAAYDGETEYGSASGTDNCDSDVSYSWTTVTDRMDADDEEAPGCYYYDREYTFVDDCGNSSTEMQRVWLTDTTPPVLISAEENRAVTCEAYNTNQGGILITAEDDCGEVTITFEDDTLSGGCVAPVGRYERTYTISDECGNSINFTQFLLLTDNTAPELVITCPNDTTLDSDEYCEVDLDPNALGYPAYTVTDNCQADEDVYVTRTYEDGPVTQICEGVYSFTRTWTVFALDPCYNHTSEVCTQEITVEDNIAPSAPGIDCPDDIVLYVDEDCAVNTMPGETGFADAMTYDNCDDNPEIFVGYTDSPKEYTCEADAGSAFELDANLGALASASASFEDDLVAVGISLDLEWAGSDCLEWPSDLTLEITSPNGDCATIAAANSDASACDDYNYPESWNTQTSGNFILNFDLTDELSGNGTWNLEVTNTWAGACGADFSLTATMIRRAEGSYTFTRTWSAYAEDCAGNTSTTNTCTQEITVIDDIAPTIDLDNTPGVVTMPCDEFDESTVYGVVALDNCDSNVQVEVLYNEDCDGDDEHGYSNDEVSGGCGGSYIRTYLATDDCGNTTTFEQIVNLVDETAPEILLICPGDITISKDEDCFANDTRSGAGEAFYEATDNCALDSVCVIVEDGPSEYSCPNSYSFVRTWTIKAYDVCENEGVATCSQTVTVVDDSAPAAPAFDCPEDLTVYRDGDCNSDAGPDADPTLNLEGNDNCTADADLEQTISFADDTVGDQSCTHQIYRTWSAYLTDECGNQSETTSCTQIITVADTLDPTIALDDVHQIDCAEYDAEGIYASASDNCDGSPSLVLNYSTAADESDLEDCAGLYLHSYTATDCSGNETTVTHLVQLIDTVAPGFDTFPEDATAACGTSIDSSVLGVPTYSDNCADSEDLTLTHSDTTVTEKDEDCRTINRYWTLTDPCGNSTTQIQVVTVEDSSFPTMDEEAEDLTVECDGEGNMTEFQNWLDTHGGAAASDDCTEELIWDYEVPVVSAGINPMLSDGCGATGEVAVTFYATDACGNSTPTTATFTIVDTQAPELASVDFPEDAELIQNATCNINTGVNLTGVATATAGDDDCCYTDVSIEYTDYPAWCLCEQDDDFEIFPELGMFDLITYAQIDAAIDGTVSFDWAYSTDDEAPMWDMAIYINGELVDTFVDEFGDLEQSGSYSFEAAAGDSIGFGIISADGILGAASVLISNFSGPSGEDFIGANASSEWDTWTGYNGSVTFSHDGETLLIEGSNIDFSCEGSYEFARVWTVYAYDECGNESDHEIHAQMITVLDETAPQFTETCGYTNGQTIAVDCEDAFGGLDIPAACNVEATDNCDSDVSITCEVDTAGEFAPNGDIVMYSQASTPAAHLANGTTCSGMDPHAMRLISLPNSDEFYTLTGGGVAEHLASGEILLTAELSSSNPNLDAGWSLSLTLDPDEACDISHTGGQLISCDPEAALGLSLEDVDAWQYFILNCEETHLEGTGLYAGSHLDLSHQPANGHYAFQLGAGANQQNGNFGLSGWFYYTGTFNEMNVMGSGDLFFDMDCCLPWSITHTCTAVDDCGNDNVFSYTFQMSGEVAGDDDSDLSGQGGSGDHTPVVIGGAGDLTTGKTPIRVTNLQPNPTNDISQLGFVVTENMRIRVDLISMDGVLVTELYDGVAQTGVNHTLDIDAEGLSGGMYQIRLTSNDYLVVKKLLVSE